MKSGTDNVKLPPFIVESLYFSWPSHIHGSRIFSYSGTGVVLTQPSWNPSMSDVTIILVSLPGAPFAEASELVPLWDSGAVPGLPAEELGVVDYSSPGCSDVTICRSDWRTCVVMASMESLWVVFGPCVDHYWSALLL